MTAGQARILTPLAGNSQQLDGGAMFGNAPRALWARWIEPDDRNRIPLACRCLLVREPDRNVLFETGIGAFFEPALRERYGVVEDRHVLLDSLAAAGLAPEDIDVVVLSHLHFDHAGGALAAWRAGEPPALVFPRAAFVVGARAWERAGRPHPRDRASFIPGLVELLERSGRLHLVSGDASELLGEGYRFHYSDGHTPGLVMTEIDATGWISGPAAAGEQAGGDDVGPGIGPVVFVSDLIPGTPWVHLPVTMGYDRYPELLIDEKRALLEDLLRRGGRLFYTHDPAVAMSGLARDDHGRFRADAPVPAS